MTNPLRLPTSDEINYAGQTMAVKAPLNPSDFPDWKERLQSHGKDLISKLTVNLQRQNDCNADSGATGEEAREYFATGSIIERARTYLYNACEYVTGSRYVGRDQGTTIQSAVRIFTEGIKSLGVAPGLPAESAYPYGSYERSASRFAERAKAAVIDESFVSEHGGAPSLDDLPLHCAAGGTVHFGVYWGIKFTSKSIGGRKYKVWSSMSGGGGGHALEVVTCLWLDGEWWPAVWNSHGDGLILMPRDIYSKYQQKQFAPFGGYGLRPDKPVERYHDRRISGGGYVLE